jgi:hypothetical protein
MLLLKPFLFLFYIIPNKICISCKIHDSTNSGICLNVDSKEILNIFIQHHVATDITEPNMAE